MAPEDGFNLGILQSEIVFQPFRFPFLGPLLTVISQNSWGDFC